MLLVGYDHREENAWIFKNSWGTGWGDDGYTTMALEIREFYPAEYPLGPYFPPSGQTYQIACVDKDDDDYCNWGISEEKPASCLLTCKPETDCNDSDPTKGPFDANFNCLPVSLLPTPTPTTPITIKELLHSYGTSDQKADLNLDKIVNALDFGQIILLIKQKLSYLLKINS